MKLVVKIKDTYLFIDLFLCAFSLVSLIIIIVIIVNFDVITEVVIIIITINWDILFF